MGDRPGAELPPISVDLMRPEDAPGVAELFRAVYGEGYPVRDYYDPATLIAANQEGRIISSVARTPEGRVVGHNALFRQCPHPRTYEAGAGLVLPAYRAANLFSRLVPHSINVGGPRFGAEMIWGEAVLNHPYTQRLAESMGYVTMTLEVDLMPAAAYVKEASAQGRVGATQHFQTKVSHPHALHLPERYAQALEDLYVGFDDQREFLTAQAPLPEAVASHLDSHVFSSAQVARIAILAAGPDLDAALARAEDQAAAQGVTVFQAWVNLGQPWSGAVTEILRRRGYFLGGALPRWFGSDGLLMQKLSHPPTWEGMVLHGERRQRLQALVRADYQSLA